MRTGKEQSPGGAWMWKQRLLYLQTSYPCSHRPSRQRQVPYSTLSLFSKCREGLTPAPKLTPPPIYWAAGLRGGTEQLIAWTLELTWGSSKPQPPSNRLTHKAGGDGQIRPLMQSVTWGINWATEEWGPSKQAHEETKRHLTWKLLEASDLTSGFLKPWKGLIDASSQDLSSSNEVILKHRITVNA